MKTPEDEAFDELERRRGGFRAKRAMAAAKLQEPAQEPVAFDAFLESEDFYNLMQTYRHFQTDAAKPFEVVKDALRAAYNIGEKLYTTPPQRPWVGLTDEEIKDIIGSWGDTPIKGYTRKLFDQIEAKLKEKNND